MKVKLLILSLLFTIPLSAQDFFFWWDDEESVPEAPLNLLATGGTNKIDLTWDASPDATSYNIYRSFAVNYNRISDEDSGFETESNFTVTGKHTAIETTDEAHSGSYSLEVVNENLVTNGTFDTGVEGWNVSNSVVKWYDSDYNDVGRVNVILDSATGTANVYFYEPINIDATNKELLLSCDYFIPVSNITTNRIYPRATGTENPFFAPGLVTGEWSSSKSSINVDAILTGFRVSQSAGVNLSGVTAGDKIYLDNIILSVKGNPANNYSALASSEITTLTAGSEIVIEVYHKSSFINDDTLTVNLGDYTNKIIPATTDWELFTDTVTVTESMAESGLKFYLNQADTIYLDDIKIYQISAPSTNELYLLAEDVEGEAYEDSPLTTDSIYYYGVKAVNDKGMLSDYSNIAGDKVE